MRLRDEDLIDRLAADYVLGTMRGRARARFERHVADDARVRGAVADWQERLLPLASSLPEEAPPPAVWTAIEGRLFGVVKQSAPAASPIRRPGMATAARWWERLALWQSVAAFATVAAIAFGVALLRQGPPTAGDIRVALLQDATGQAGVALRLERATDGSDVLVARVLRRPEAMGPDRVIELWAVPPAGAPRSLGVVQAGADAVRLPVRDASALLAAAALAASIEPPGGSPTGAPTGPVVYQGALYPI